MSDTRTERPSNRLANETSPYLLQHATNPVDWYPWGPEALARAKAEDKPIFLSIGYAACHWCHVMERESFEDEATAQLMNEHFVCIKVDREERPDLDEIYMAATIAMSGGGGWPMSVFLTPEREPFFAGTYFPPTNRYGKPSFKTVLTKLAEAWREDRDVVVEQSKELTAAVRANTATGAPGPLSDALLDAFVKQCERAFDATWGGFGGAPKFPPAATIELLLRHAARTGDEASLRMATRTLDGMKDGGMYDHVGGGFARYSVDAEWHVPHFEKMLYDNALLAHAYVEAWQLTKDPALRRVAIETLDYVAREMQGEHGGYFSATDADSEGVEGKFFVWSLREIEAILDEGDARRFAAFYDVSEEGNWEGHNVLRAPRPLEEVARDVGWAGTLAGLRENLDASRAKLYAARARRVPPLLDDKVLVAWNGLMIRAMAFAGRALGEPRYVESAVRASAMIERELRRADGGLFRTYRAGKAHLAAYLEDHAFYADGLVDLYEATGDETHLRRAEALVDRCIADFGGERGDAFYLTANDHEALVTRTADGADGATPNGNAVAARALLRVAAHLARPELAQRAIAALRAHGATIARAPRAFATSLSVVDALLEPAIEIAITGEGPDADALEREVGATFLPTAVLARGRAPSPLPLLGGKPTDTVKAFVCRGFACDAPVSDPDALRAAITRAKAASAEARETALP